MDGLPKGKIGLQWLSDQVADRTAWLLVENPSRAPDGSEPMILSLKSLRGVKMHLRFCTSFLQWLSDQVAQWPIEPRGHLVTWPRGHWRAGFATLQMNARMFRLVGILMVLTLGSPIGVTAKEKMGVDLTISGIVPSATEPPKVLVIVRNLGHETFTRSVDVELWLDKQLLGRQQFKEKLGPGKAAYVVFMRPIEMPPGLHNFTATVDPSHAVGEPTTDNNTRGITVWVKKEAGVVPAPSGLQKR